MGSANRDLIIVTLAAGIEVKRQSVTREIPIGRVANAVVTRTIVVIVTVMDFLDITQTVR